MKKTAWVAGATGLIGGHLMTLLCEHERYEKVIALVRKPSDAPWSNHPKVEQWKVDYRDLSSQLGRSVDDVFCALGSTTKKTPDKKTYYEIDVTFPLNTAQLGLQKGARFFGLVSAHGANPKAFSYYMKMKGELEQALRKLDYSHQAFARPSLLSGDRKEFRPAEKAGEFLMGLLPGNYKTIKALDVAAALVHEANTQHTGIQILESSQMQGASKAL